jgi:hypothetical protein
MHVPNTGAVSANIAVGLIASGKATANMTVKDALTIKSQAITNLPTGLRVPTLSVYGPISALPDQLQARRIRVRGGGKFTLGREIRCDRLDLADSHVETLPADLQARDRIDLSGCLRLKQLPTGLRTGTLNLSGCTALTELPPGLDVAFLELSGCTALRQLPTDLKIRGGRLSVRDCPWITSLPSSLGEISELDVSGCLNLATLPAGLTVTSWVDLAGSAIRTLPPGLNNIGLRWRGMPVSHQIVFEPQSLKADQILLERNAELRRVMMERFGYDRLFEVAEATVLDRDSDAGGERRLLRLPIEGDEDLVCVAVQCPSTGHRFVLRVPPSMTTCRQAVAWTAGYDNPNDYAPVQET